jgi:hypothetical protein
MEVTSCFTPRVHIFIPELKLSDPGQHMQINNAINSQYSDIPQYFPSHLKLQYFFILKILDTSREEVSDSQ